MHGTSGETRPARGTVPPMCMTVAELAQQLRVTERYVFMLIERDELPSFRMGVRRLFRTADVQSYIDRLVAEERAMREHVASA